MLAVELRSKCGGMVKVRGLSEPVQIAIPMQTDAYSVAQWAAIEAYKNGSAVNRSAMPLCHELEEVGSGAGAAEANASDLEEVGSGSGGDVDVAVACVGNCSEVGYCGAHGACVGGVCECEPGYVGAGCRVAVGCRYWDTVALHWSSEGCRPAPPSGPPDGYLHCDCTHLTDFGGIAIPTSTEELLNEVSSIKFNTFTLTEAFDVLNNFDLEANPHIYAVVFALAGANLLTLVWASWRGHRRKLNKHRAVLKRTQLRRSERDRLELGLLPAVASEPQVLS